MSRDFTFQPTILFEQRLRKNSIRTFPPPRTEIRHVTRHCLPSRSSDVFILRYSRFERGRGSSTEERRERVQPRVRLDKKGWVLSSWMNGSGGDLSDIQCRRRFFMRFTIKDISDEREVSFPPRGSFPFSRERSNSKVKRFSKGGRGGKKSEAGRKESRDVAFNSEIDGSRIPFSKRENRPSARYRFCRSVFVALAPVAHRFENLGPGSVSLCRKRSRG